MTRRAAWAAACAGIASLACSCAPKPPPVSAAPPPAAAAHVAAAATESLAVARLAIAWPRLGAPRLDSLGHLDWSPRPYASLDAGRARREFERAPDSLSAWRTIAANRSSLLRPYALRRVALLALSRADSLAADRALDTLASIRSPWGWEALRLRCDLAAAAGRPGRAESLLAVASPADWSELDRAAVLLRRATLAAGRGDVARAEELARQLLDRFPALPPAGAAVDLLGQLSTARGGSLPPADVQRAAESARLRGDREQAVLRFQQVHAAARGEARTRAAINLVRALRESRRFDAGLDLATRSLKGVSDATLRARLRLERARLLRDGGRGVEAIRLYASLTSAAVPDDVAAAAAWERAIELTSAGRDREARLAFSRAAELGGDHASEARLMGGLLWLAGAEPARALSEWRGVRGEAFEFWRGVVERRAPGDSAQRAHADSALAAIATRPGYGFYRVAARETLGVAGWAPPSALTTVRCPGEPAAFGLCRALLVLGDADAAMLVLQRWSNLAETADAPATDADALDCPVAWSLEAATLAAAAGRLGTAIRMAQRALDRSPQVDSRRMWALVPWIYPPGQDSLYAALPDSLVDGPIDRPLLRAVAWQESRFDPQARSRSDALGLYQLKLGTAGDMARRLGDPPPTREQLFDPAASVRYGREYLEWLLGRLDAPWIVALSAYNSGPSSVSDRWRQRRAQGGDALFCELIGRPETRDYVRKIIGARQAYRELSPHAAATPDTAPR